MKSPWHAFSAGDVLNRLASSERGLVTEEAKKRIITYGANSLPEEKKPSFAVRFVDQFRSPLIYVLLVAGLIVLAMGETADGLIIFFVLFFNAIVGLVQEGRAQNTLLALKKYIETKAVVLRDGVDVVVIDTEVVPGDVIILREGERVPADARILESSNLRLDESSLTGESIPVRKDAKSVYPSETPIAEQHNMVFRGTHVVAGNGKAVVVGTGVETVIGSIAKQISGLDAEMPLKANIRNLSKAIIGVVFTVSVFLFFAGLFFGHSIKDMFAVVVSLSVSVIPEGLPIVMTLVLASGVWRMSKKNALVKKLPAVEALGQASIIAVDKTGTVTRNELIVTEVWVGGVGFDVSGVGYQPKGVVVPKDRSDTFVQKEVSILAESSVLSANARLLYAEDAKEWRITGDPTEAAMLVFGEKFGFHKDDVVLRFPLVDEIPFDYRLKYHATAHAGSEGSLVVVTGAPEAVLAMCDHVLIGGENHLLSAQHGDKFEEVFKEMSGRGLRVLAMAISRNTGTELSEDSTRHLSFVGYFGMRDTLRPEARDAVLRAKDAGIRVVMITGDHKITAQAIAKDAGIYFEGDTVLTGDDLRTMSDNELVDAIASVSVFARVTPEHKMRIINAYKRRGETIAMTGDGVNDAPSLVAADLGVAMGKSGTEVAKEASDIVLLDDNFGSIVSAVEEGRNMYKTIQKVILYLFSTSAGEVLVIATALLLGYPLPITAAQIIWLNFVTDGFLDVSLAMEPKEKDLLSGVFRRPEKYLISRLMAWRILGVGVSMAVGTMFLFAQYVGTDLVKAQTVALTTLAVFQWFNAWNCRSETRSVFGKGFLGNKYLIGATLLVIALQLFAIYTPFLQRFLGTVPLHISDWITIIVVAMIVVVVEEVRKFWVGIRK